MQARAARPHVPSGNGASPPTAQPVARSGGWWSGIAPAGSSATPPAWIVSTRTPIASRSPPKARCGRCAGRRAHWNASWTRSASCGSSATRSELGPHPRSPAVGQRRLPYPARRRRRHELQPSLAQPARAAGCRSRSADSPTGVVTRTRAPATSGLADARRSTQPACCIHRQPCHAFIRPRVHDPGSTFLLAGCGGGHAPPPPTPDAGWAHYGGDAREHGSRPPPRSRPPMCGIRRLRGHFAAASTVRTFLATNGTRT